MEKNIPGLKRQYNIHLAKLRADKPTLDAATGQLTYWSAKYRELVTESDNLDPGTGIYGAILDAYARREALRQYLEEVRQNAEHDTL